MSDNEIKPAAPTTKTITHTTREKGELKFVIDQFAAFDGLEFRKGLVDYHRSYDASQRRAYMCEVLSYVTVLEGEERTALTNVNVINEYCDDWRLLDHLFNETLALNHISHEVVGGHDKEQWELAGVHLAKGFFSAGTRVMSDINMLAEIEAAANAETEQAAQPAQAESNDKE